MTAPRRPPGFTLVEVLVGALVLGIFVSFVYGAVVSAFQVRSVIQSTTTALASGTAAVELVAGDLANAFLVPVEGSDGFKAQEETGRWARFDFLTTVDSRGQEEVDRRMLRSDVTEVGYRIRQGEKGGILYRREQFGVDDAPLEGGDYHKVVEGVGEFTVEWYEKDPTADDAAGGTEEPLKEWDAKERKEKDRRLPRAAKILLVLEGPATDPSRAGETDTFRFTRWVVLPGADDEAPEEKPAGNTPPPGG